MDKNLTLKLQDFLNTPKEEKDWEEGAILLLQLTNNPIMYRNISLNPKGKAEFIEGKLRQFLKARLDIEQHEEVVVMQQQVNTIIESRTEFKENNPADDFKAGKRADHDRLPEDIQSLYVENLDITHRMRELHLRLRLLSEDTKLHSDAERKPLLDEFISLDKKLHDNWNTYDHFVISEETAESAEKNQSDNTEHVSSLSSPSSPTSSSSPITPISPKKGSPTPTPPPTPKKNKKKR